MTQNSSACPAHLLVEIALLAAESAETWVDARPGPAGAREQSETLHPDLKRIGDAVIKRPLPVHGRAPGRIEVTRGRPIEPVPKQWALDQVHAGGVFVKPADQCGQRAGLDKH